MHNQKKSPIRWGGMGWGMLNTGGNNLLEWRGRARVVRCVQDIGRSGTNSITIPRRFASLPFPAPIKYYQLSTIVRENPRNGSTFSAQNLDQTLPERSDQSGSDL